MTPRGNDIYDRNVSTLRERIDRMFVWILLAQWVFAIALSLVISPHTYSGTASSLHPHVKSAVLLGFVINVLPITLAITRPGWWLTRHSIAMAQMLWSAMLIMITGGRIETHFHVFGSLAFLAFYRDWTLLANATVVVAADHLLRGMFWPDSVYGVANPEWWRFLEHAAWVAFEDVILVLGCLQSLREMRAVAEREALLEATRDRIEIEVENRTRELAASLAETRAHVEAEKKLEAELRHAQKLESVGRLAAGVAHEINTPMQFVSDSVVFAREAFGELAEVLVAQQAVVDAVRDRPSIAALANHAGELAETCDLDYVVTELPLALDRALDGTKRVATIVRSMKVFSHDQRHMTSFDLNEAIASTLTVATNEYKYVANVELDLAELPQIIGNPGQINQVLLNIVINAAQAIGDVVAQTGKHGTIKVATRRDGDVVVISIADTGSGISAEHRERVFDPFFTTKPVGKGTGQGLSIARAVIVENHHGALDFESVIGVGTRFDIRLPILQHQEAAS